MSVIEETLEIGIMGVESGEAVKTVWEAQTEQYQDILIIRNAVPFLTDIPEICERAGGRIAWGDSGVVSTPREFNTAGEQKVDYDRRSSSSTALAAVPGVIEELQIMAGKLEASHGALVKIYMEKVNPHMVVLENSMYELLRYCKGQKFGVHVDSIRSDKTLAQRRLSVVAFCNGDFEGGELIFPRQNLEFKPEAGMFVMFPSGPTHPHEVREVTGGTRYSVVAWYY